MESCDILVIGGGPAGVEAAVAAATAQLRVVLVDEADAAGGQVYRARPAGFRGAEATPENRDGDRLRAKLAESRVEAIFGHAVWSVSPGFRVDALGPNGARAWIARTVVAATGALERVVPFPGWTTPGVIGLAGATVLLKSQHMLPGRRTLVAGCGPLLLAVAAGLLKAGGDVAAVVDLASPGHWAARLPALAGRPDLIMRGAGWLARVKRAGVPVLSRHAILRVEPGAGGLLAVVGPVDGTRRPAPGPERSFAVDAVAVGHGLTPSTDVTRLLRVEHLFDPLRGGWIARLDADGRSSLPGLSVAGDGGGIAGAAAAAIDGRLAGLAAARDLGAITPGEHGLRAAPLRPQAARARRFGHAMADLMALRPGQVDAIPPDTVVCRCEDVTRAEIEAAMTEGSASANQLKAWTRCGMGPCQGRICGDVAGAILARVTGRHADVGTFTGRTPFRPLSLDRLADDRDYADIALPPPAPL